MFARKYYLPLFASVLLNMKRYYKSSYDTELTPESTSAIPVYNINYIGDQQSIIVYNLSYDQERTLKILYKPDLNLFLEIHLLNSFDLENTHDQILKKKVSFDKKYRHKYINANTSAEKLAACPYEIKIEEDGSLIKTMYGNPMIIRLTNIKANAIYSIEAKKYNRYHVKGKFELSLPQTLITKILFSTKLSFHAYMLNFRGLYLLSFYMETILSTDSTTESEMTVTFRKAPSLSLDYRKKSESDLNYIDVCTEGFKSFIDDFLNGKGEYYNGTVIEGIFQSKFFALDIDTLRSLQKKVYATFLDLDIDVIEQKDGIGLSTLFLRIFIIKTKKGETAEARRDRLADQITYMNKDLLEMWWDKVYEYYQESWSEQQKYWAQDETNGYDYSQLCSVINNNIKKFMFSLASGDQWFEHLIKDNLKQQIKSEAEKDLTFKFNGVDYDYPSNTFSPFSPLKQIRSDGYLHINPNTISEIKDMTPDIIKINLSVLRTKSSLQIPLLFLPNTINNLTLDDNYDYFLCILPELNDYICESHSRPPFPLTYTIDIKKAEFTYLKYEDNR
jgi:hypothetical protein